MKIVVLNRPQKLNILNHEMICQIKKNLQLYENDPSVKLVILKANGKAFCAGGDIVSIITSSLAGKLDALVLRKFKNPSNWPCGVYVYAPLDG